MNELRSETSPYLLQHAENPVHWRAWNDKSLQEAKQKKRLIILSSGYSACHWCHVMEHECFEDEEVAEIMNDHYVSIKVDREERPDVDAVYMKAVQLMTQHGGWPMNVICLPDGRPVWGGTYFPKEQWISSLSQLAAIYKSDPGKMVEYADKLQEGMNAISIIESEKADTQLKQEKLETLISKLKRSFDKEYGGFARAPKFMLPNNFRFLLRYGSQQNDVEVLDHVFLSLEKMAFGGLFDTIGGGFSRYSVDMRWHVPHFEKMLYDNGQMISLYSEAYKLTKNPLYAEVIDKTLEFISRELTDADGGFFCALDADSLNPEGKLEEGAFYVWTKADLQNILGNDFDLFSQTFNINEFGHWEHGNYVLIQNLPLENIAANNNISANDLSAKKKSWERLLLNERDKRSRPRLDDKKLTSWNSLMLTGFIDAYKATGNENYRETAVRNAEFLLNNLWIDGKLFRNHKNGKATIDGYLDDHAFLIEALINLYTAEMNEKWLNVAKQLTDHCLDHFYEDDSGFFTFAANDSAPLVAKHYEIEDNVISASNSVMAWNLVRLSIFFSNTHYEKIAKRMIAHVVEIADYPSAFSNWLNVLMDFSDQNRELAIVGTNANEYLPEFNSQYIPNVIVAAAAQPSSLPFLENRFAENQTLFYVCRNKSCEMPESDFSSALQSLKPLNKP